MIDPSDRDDFVSDDYSRGNLLVTVTDHGSYPIRQLREALQQEVERQRFEMLGVRATITGVGMVSLRALDDMVVETMWGFVYAFAIVVALEWILFKSVRAALISIAPNLIPVGACFATIFLLGMGLRIDNSLFLCVSVGGLFNTTIHIVARVMQQEQAGQVHPDEMIERALRTVGPASFYSAAILSMGFAVLLASGFSGLRQLGLLSMVTLITAFFADAIVTSTLMRSFYNWGHVARRADAGIPIAAAARDA
jgi:predicted RND superfamily exporter protein